MVVVIVVVIFGKQLVGVDFIRHVLQRLAGDTNADVDESPGMDVGAGEDEDARYNQSLVKGDQPPVLASVCSSALVVNCH